MAVMDTELERLLAEVDAYLEKSGMGKTQFGKLSVNDVAVLGRMRAGKPVTSRTMSRIRAFMADNPPKESDDVAA
jgi:hypothetical protein